MSGSRAHQLMDVVAVANSSLLPAPQSGGSGLGTANNLGGLSDRRRVGGTCLGKAFTNLSFKNFSCLSEWEEGSNRFMVPLLVSSISVHG